MVSSLNKSEITQSLQKKKKKKKNKETHQQSTDFICPYNANIHF